MSTRATEIAPDERPLTSTAPKGIDRPILGIFIALGACAIAGAISGFFVVKMKVNSFIATLGMSQVITAFVLHTANQSISGVFDKSYLNIGQKQVFGQPRGRSGTSRNRLAPATCSPPSPPSSSEHRN